MNECVTPRPAARRSRSNELVDLGANGLVDLRLASVTRRLTEYALEYCGGNLEWAADEIGVNVSTVRRWLHEWALEDAGAPALTIVPAGALEEAAAPWCPGARALTPAGQPAEPAP